MKLLKKIENSWKGVKSLLFKWDFYQTYVVRRDLTRFEIYKQVNKLVYIVKRVEKYFTHVKKVV